MSDVQAVAEEKITLRLPRALLARVDRAAGERGVRRSEYVRQALIAHTEEVSVQPVGSTLYDLLQADGVLGRFAGPPGLSMSSRAALRERIRARYVPAGMSSEEVRR